MHKFSLRVCVALQGMWLEKYRVFHVAFALCLSVSLVGGWLNESFGQRLKYQKQWFGFGGPTEKENQLVLAASGFLVHTTAQRCPATYSMKRGTYQIHHRRQGTESNYPKHFC